MYFNRLQTNLNYYCDKATLRVRPQRGRALVWYNHVAASGGAAWNGEPFDWWGAYDPMALHGTCTVKDGDMWTANIWIKVSDSREFDLAST
jgi:hypoxia-inducible factor prolyl 4-hydroxylase